MSNTGSWSVKGIDDRARAVAKEKARMRGVTLGDYINDLLLQGHSEAGPRDLQQRLETEIGEPSTLDRLTRKLEAVEARSTLAITGIDQSVLGLIARLENAESSTSVIASEVDGMVDELRETQDVLREKITALEADDTSARNLESMRSLEDALGKLANHVYDEARMAQDETTAIKGRLESGFADLGDRVEGMELKVDRTLSEAAARVEKSVEQAELRTEGTVKHVSERLSAIETSVAGRLETVGDMGARMDSVEADVSGALSSMEGTLLRIQERLNRAETTTDAALKGLEQTFSSLDARISQIAKDADPQKVEHVRQQLEQRFEALSVDLRSSVENARNELANQIEAAATGENPEFMGRIENTIETLKQRLVTGEERSNRAVEAVSQQMGRLSTGMDARLQAVEQREDNVLEQVSAKIGDVAEQLDQRIEESEQRSAGAIEQVGEQVATAVSRLQAKQESAMNDLKDEVAAADKRHEARLSNALSNVSDRLRQIQKQTVDHVSPVQKAMASLAARLEALEDFTSPPGTPIQPAPTFEAPDPQMLEIEAFDALDTEPEPIPEVAPEAEAMDGVQDFMEVLQTFEDEDAPQAPADTVSDLLTEAADDDYQPTDSHRYVAELPEESFDEPDPFADIETWGDDSAELRDTEVFSPETDITVPEPMSDLPHTAEDTPDEVLPVDQDATDYLSRARSAAIAAASDKHGHKRTRGRKRDLPGNRVAKSGGSSKLPIIAAASVLALTAAGGGAYMSLRGKQAPTTPVQTADDLALNPTVTATPEVADASLDDVLFEEAIVTAETTTDIAAPSATLNALKPIEETATPKTAPPTIPKALTLERAAAEGNAVAQYQYGEQRLAAKDYQRGPQMIQQAANQGLPAAQYRLAKLHEEGLGVPRDLTAARAWTQKAAEGGNIKAMHDLAVFYADGEGGPQSYAGSAKWFRQAADFGLVDSQYNLAILHEEGLGVSPSATEALFWYEVALRNGDAGAKAEIDRVRTMVPLDTAQAVAQRAESWVRATPVATANGVFGPSAWGTGSREQVKAVQTVLNGLGYEAGTPDGVAGAGTRTAIRAFQADNGMATTGEITDELVDRLNQEV